MDNIKKSVEPRITSGSGKQFVTLSGSRATVKLQLELYCAKNYYGPSCSVECIPRDDSSGHYTCDNQGRKVAGDIGMEVAALGGVSREMIHSTVTSTVTNRVTGYVFPVMKGHIVRDV